MTRTRANLSYLLLGIVALAMVFPFAYMIFISLNSDATSVSRQPSSNSYREVFRLIPFARYYVNSTLVAIAVTLGQVFTSALAAYAFARMKWRGRDKIFLCYLGTMMIPGLVTMIPNFVLLGYMPGVAAHFLGPWWNTYLVAPGTAHAIRVGRAVGTNSYFALIVPAIFSAYGTFMLRQFFMGISPELEEAATIDGCGHWGSFTRIVLPVSQPALATLGILTFIGNWRSFMWPLIVTSQDYLRSLPVGVQASLGLYSTDSSFLMAAATMMILPMIIVFLVGQKFLLSGLQMSGVRG